MSDPANSVAFMVRDIKPVPQGSMRVRFQHGKAGQCWANASRLIPWRQAIAWAWRQALGERAWSLSPDEAIIMDLEFYFARPRGHYKCDGTLKEDAPRYPIRTSVGDTDKLVRGVGDSLTGKAFADDSQVVRINASKHYSEKGVEGAHVVVTRLVEGQ